jgi:hypothetical protein
MTDPSGWARMSFAAIGMRFTTSSGVSPSM